MRIACIGGGPAGLYLAILAKNAFPDDDILVLERNRANETHGFGVVFSDATLEHLGNADRPSYQAILDSFLHWDDIEIFYRGERLRSTGHGFCGMSRKTLLRILQERADAVGVKVEYEREIASDADFADYDLVVGCDGLNSVVREQHKEHFKPTIDMRPNRFVWLGTTVPFDAFTFYFNHTDAGLFQVHAYRYEDDTSTFIVECSEETFRRSGLDENDEDATVAYLSKVFEKELAGHPLLKNRSIWRQFPTVENERWHHENVVLIGDAVHTAHYSIGSGTKLAMEDAISLIDSLVARRAEIDAAGSASQRKAVVTEALAAYEAERRGPVESVQRAAQVSLEWFENTERAMKLEPIEFAFSLLTRSLRVTHDNLQMRDPAFIKKVDAFFAAKEAKRSGVSGAPDAPPMFTPYKMRGLTLPNRVVVSPMCMYSAEDGTVNDWHLVHLGSRAIGGAGLIIAEMTDVSEDGRITPGCAGMYRPEHLGAWRRITDFVHRYTPAKIALQLGHAGAKGATRRMWEGMDEPLREGGWPLSAASALPYLAHSVKPQPLTRKGMDQVVADYEIAAEMALEAGFDMLEVHMAHGYLLASFISPLTNQRTDEYGGAIDNRMRFPLEVFDAVRAKWPGERPMSVRISATDWKEGGLSQADLLAAARLLKEHGVDILDVSTGQTVSDAQPKFGRLFQTPYSDLVRNEVDIPTMTVGNVSSYTDVNGILAARRADLCVLARAHLFDPYWTHHAAQEQGHALPWPDQYPLTGYNPRFK